MTRATGGVVNFVLRLILIAAALAVWEALVRLLEVPAFILPTPSSIFTALYRGIASTLYLNHIGVTLAETLIGFVVGTVLAFAILLALRSGLVARPRGRTFARVVGHRMPVAVD